MVSGLLYLVNVRVMHCFGTEGLLVVA